MASNPAAWYSVSWTIVRDYVKSTQMRVKGKLKDSWGTEEEKEDDDDNGT